MPGGRPMRYCQCLQRSFVLTSFTLQAVKEDQTLQVRDLQLRLADAIKHQKAEMQRIRSRHARHRLKDLERTRHRMQKISKHLTKVSSMDSVCIFRCFKTATFHVSFCPFSPPAYFCRGCWKLLVPRLPSQ